MSLRLDSGCPLQRTIPYLCSVKLERRFVWVDGTPELECLAEAHRIREIEVDKHL